MPGGKKLEELRAAEYQARLVVDRLRRQEVEAAGEPAAEFLDELEAAEEALQEAEEARAAAEQAAGGGLLFDSVRKPGGHLGVKTTGLDVKVYLEMEHVPTAIYHLFDAERNPLLSCRVHNVGSEIRRMRVTSFIEGYSARAVSTVEVEPGEKPEIKQLPTLFPAAVRDLTELARATLNVIVEDLDGRVEQQRTEPIWLLARTTAPLQIKNPKTGGYEKVYHYFGAFVTPNAPALMSYLRVAANYHPRGRLVGYQGSPDEVTPQVKALFDALKFESGVTYVNSVLDMHPDAGAKAQRVRLPRESLADRQANCIDGTVLLASLLEAISLSPALVIVPGHAFVAWETWTGSNEWRYLETTRIGTHSFEEACERGAYHAKRYAARMDLLPLRELRAKRGIMPME